MRYWDKERNTQNPETTLQTSNTFVHWRCPVEPEHRWMMSVKTMSRNPICPGCNPGNGIDAAKRINRTSEIFADAYPELSASFHRTYNGDTTTRMITAGSPNKYWWYCAEHDVSWMTTAHNRAHGTGCPLCKASRIGSSRKAKFAGRSLGDLYPSLTNQWDSDKNTDTPYDYSPGSHHKAYWVCGKHKIPFVSAICNVVAGAGCRKCTLEKISIANTGPKPGQSLEDVFPEIAKEWDYELNSGVKPSDVACKTDKSYHWICPVNSKHRYVAQVNNRTVGGTGCPFCSGKKAFKGETDLGTTHRHLLDEWDYALNDIEPDEITAGSHYMAHWICSKNPEHRWFSVVKARALQDSGCPQCKAQLVGDINAIPPVGQSLEDVYPDIANCWCDELNGGVTPSQVCCGSTKKFYWVCPNNRDHPPFLMSVEGRVSSAHGCPLCGRAAAGAYNAMPKNGNSLLDRFPDLAGEWSDTLNEKHADEVCYASSVPGYWVCKNGHDPYMMTPSARTLGGSGCPECARLLRISYPETAIYYYVHNAYPDAIQGYRPDIPGFGRFELDVYIPSRSTAIEYDGEHWHMDADRDSRKESQCFSNNISLIRIREEGCVKYQTILMPLIIRERPYNNDSLTKSIMSLMQWLGHPSADVDLARDEQSIRALMRTGSM